MRVRSKSRVSAFDARTAMLRWDALGETRVSFGATSGDDLASACAALHACTVPLVVHDYQRAAVLGTATLHLAAGRTAQIPVCVLR